MNHLCKGLVLLLLGAGYAAVAQESAVDDLIEQTGIEAGATAMRDMPGWRKPKKIVIYGGWFIDPDLQSVAPGLNIVRAQSAEEAMRTGRGNTTGCRCGRDYWQLPQRSG